MMPKGTRPKRRMPKWSTMKRPTLNFPIPKPLGRQRRAVTTPDLDPISSDPHAPPAADLAAPADHARAALVPDAPVAPDADRHGVSDAELSPASDAELSPASDAELSPASDAELSPASDADDDAPETGPLRRCVVTRERAEKAR